MPRRQFFFQLAVMTFVLIIWPGHFCLAAPPPDWSKTLPPKASSEDAYGLAFSPDGHWLALGHGILKQDENHGRLELWNVRQQRLERILGGFNGPVESLAFSPDGQWLLSGSTEMEPVTPQGKSDLPCAEIRIWNPATGELLKSIHVKNAQMAWLSLSPDGTHLAFATRWKNSLPTGEVRLARMDSLQGGEIHSIKIQGFSFQGQLARLRIPRAVFSPDGKVLALSQERKIRLLELETRKNLRTFSVPGGTIQSLAFSRDGTKLACASFDYFRGESAGVWVWDLPSGRIVHKLEHRDNFAFSLEFLPEGNGLLIGGVAPSLPGSRNPSERSGEIFFWDWDKDRLWPFATGKPGPVLSLTFSLNGQLLAFRNRRDSFSVCARDRGSYRLLPMDQSSSPTSSRQIEKMILSAERIQRVSFSKDGKQLAGVSSEGDIHLWETRTGALLWNYPDPKKTGNCFAISPDGTGWARCQDSQIVLRQFHAPDQFRHLESPQEELKALAFSADGKALLAGSAQGGIYSWDLGDAGHFRLIAREAGSIEVLTFSPDGLHFAIANRKGTIEWREYPSGQLKGTWKPGVITVNSLAFSPDASLLAAGTSETSLLIFDLPSGQLRQTLRQHTAAINGLAFSPDGKFLASGGDDRMVILWDLSSGRPKQIFKNHVQTVTSLVFAPDGLLLACGHGNNSVVLWNTQNKKLERILTLPELIQVRK